MGFRNVVSVDVPIVPVLGLVDGIEDGQSLRANEAVVRVDDGHDVAVAAVLLDPEEHVAERAQVLQVVHDAHAVGEARVGGVEVVEDAEGRLVRRVVVHVDHVEVAVVLPRQRLEEQLVRALREDLVPRRVHAHRPLLAHAPDAVPRVVVVELLLPQQRVVGIFRQFRR